MFCYNCVQKYMTKHATTTCAACLQGATGVVEFSAPMEMPFSSVIAAEEAEKKEPITVNSTQVSN
jgi:hypothetical protein